MTLIPSKVYIQISQNQSTVQLLNVSLMDLQSACRLLELAAVQLHHKHFYTCLKVEITFREDNTYWNEVV